MPASYTISDNTNRFAGIARSHFAELEQALPDVLALQQRALKDPRQKEVIEHFLSERERIVGLAHVCVVFATTATDSFICGYAIVNSSNAFVSDRLDRLDLVSKWVVIPRIFGEQGLATESQAFEFLRKLVKVRNDLVHYKPTLLSDENFEIADKDGDFETPVAQARNAIAALDALAEASLRFGGVRAPGFLGSSRSPTA